MAHKHLSADIEVDCDAAGVPTLTLRSIAPSGWLGRLGWRLRRRFIRPARVDLLAPIDTPLFVEMNSHTAWLHANANQALAQTTSLAMCSLPEINAAHLERTFAAQRSEQ